MKIEEIRYESKDKQRIHKIEIEVEFDEECTQHEAINKVMDDLSPLLMFGNKKAVKHENSI
jgi:hypothetical protein